MNTQHKNPYAAPNTNCAFLCVTDFLSGWVAEPVLSPQKAETERQPAQSEAKISTAQAGLMQSLWNAEPRWADELTGIAGQSDASDAELCLCGSTAYRDVPIHDEQSIRRDCARCGRFLCFPTWYGRDTQESPQPARQRPPLFCRSVAVAPVPSDFDAGVLDTWPNPCPTCGGLELWETIKGEWRCQHCDPPTASRRLLRHAERLQCRSHARETNQTNDQRSHGNGSRRTLDVTRLAGVEQRRGGAVEAMKAEEQTQPRRVK